MSKGHLFMSNVSNQINSAMLELNARLLQDTLDTSSKIRETKSDNQMVYAKEGEARYEEAMDEDKDGTITYDEYMKYCEENAASQYTENPGLTVVQKEENSEAQVQSIRPLNIGKALSTYSHNSIKMPEAKIESEA